MRISDWSSDVCSSDLEGGKPARQIAAPACAIPLASLRTPEGESSTVPSDTAQAPAVSTAPAAPLAPRKPQRHTLHGIAREDPYARSEEHTSELQSLMRNSYAVFCLKKKKTQASEPRTHNMQQN